MLKNHITKEEALARIRDVWQPSPGTEEIPLEQCDGRIAAEDCVANVSLPVVRAAGMDGICVNFNLLENGIPDASGWERGREYDRADTGDDFDDRYDTVLPIEWIHPVDCQEGRDSADSREEREASAGPCEEGIGNGHGLRIVPVPVHGPGRHRNHTGRPDEPELYRGMNVRPSGSLIEEGTLLIRAGMRITPLDIAALATGGYGHVRVIRRPVISFLPTGTELVPAGSAIRRGQNFDANSPMAAALLTELGADARVEPIEKDAPQSIEERLHSAMEKSDIILINGGSSKGEEDFNTHILEEQGRQLFHWVKAAPGRPMSAAILDGKLVINLAGPTLGAYYGILWCVRELMQDWYGTDISWGQEVEAVLEQDLPSPPLSLILRLTAWRDEEGTWRVNGSANRAISQPDANAVYFTRLGTPAMHAGDLIRICLVR